MSKLQSGVLGILAGILVIEGLIFWNKNNQPKTSSLESVKEEVTVKEVLPIPESPETPESSPISQPVTLPVESPVVPVVGYGDVLVVMNLDSSESQEIGEYFAAQRDIPLENLVYINSTTSEEINDVEFQGIRTQIENHLKTNDLVQKINYIVTTKGVPLKVKRGEFNSDGKNASALDPERKSASVDSELTLIFSQDSQYIGNSGSLGQRYLFAEGHFTKTKYDMYLVTRLDGYTVADVRALIDRAKNPILSVSVIKFVLDQDPGWTLNLNDQLATAAKSLMDKGFNVVLDTTEKFLTGQQNVIGYVSWGSNDKHFASSSEYAKPKNIWAPGAIAETYVSTSGRTFRRPAIYGQSLIADLIEEGVTGVKGYVYEPYSSAMTNVSVLFDYYTNGYNLAESFYVSSPFISWMGVVIGDPKMVLKIEK